MHQEQYLKCPINHLLAKFLKHPKDGVNQKYEKYETSSLAVADEPARRAIHHDKRQNFKTVT